MWSHFVTFRSKAAAWLTAGLGSFAALALAFAMGAFEAAEKPQLPRITAGQSMEAGKWRIKPLKIWATSQKIYGVRPKEGQKAVVLEVELMNRTIESDSNYFSTFQWPAEIAGKVERPMIYLTRDETLAPGLQPGMPEKMAYVWLMPDDVATGNEVELAIEAWGFKYRNNLTGTPGWWSKNIVGSLRLPLQKEQG
jgi:hypothetical protein